VTAGAAVYAWLATDLRPFTLPALAATLLGGGLAVVFGATVLPDRVPRRSPPRHRGVWAGLAAALGLWELSSFLQHPRAEHPTLSSLTNTVFESHPARTLGLLVWLAAGAALSRRVTPSPTRTGRALLLMAWLWLGWHTFVRGSYL